MVPSLRVRSGRGRTTGAGSHVGHLNQDDGANINFVRAESQEGLEERCDSDRAEEDIELEEVAGARDEGSRPSGPRDRGQDQQDGEKTGAVGSSQYEERSQDFTAGKPELEEGEVQVQVHKEEAS